jgi:entericidin A
LHPRGGAAGIGDAVTAIRKRSIRSSDRWDPIPVSMLNYEEKSMKRVIALMLLSMFSVAMLSGCNTVAGAGKDVQKAGEKVEDAAHGN